MGPWVPSVYDSVEIPEAPQVRPQGPVMVLEPGPELGPLSLVCTESHPRSKAGPTSSTNHTEI